MAREQDRSVWCFRELALGPRAFASTLLLKAATKVHAGPRGEDTSPTSSCWSGKALEGVWDEPHCCGHLWKINSGILFKGSAG